MSYDCVYLFYKLLSWSRSRISESVNTRSVWPGCRSVCRDPQCPAFTGRPLAEHPSLPPWPRPRTLGSKRRTWLPGDMRLLLRGPLARLISTSLGGTVQSVCPPAQELPLASPLGFRQAGLVPHGPLSLVRERLILGALGEPVCPVGRATGPSRKQALPHLCQPAPIPCRPAKC